MKNFRPPQVPTISPNLLNQSCDVKLVPSNHVQDSLATRCLSTEEWTDEKHSMYLKSMEASFVNQLFNSKQGLAWRSPKATLPHSTPTTSTQWKDLDNGYWKKMKYEREKKGQVSRRNALEAKSWIEQWSCSSGSVTCRGTSEDTECGLSQRNQIPSTTSHHMLFFSDIGTHFVEMTDQNFVDDDEVGECCDKKNVKRFKPLISDDTSMHQCY